MSNSHAEHHVHHLTPRRKHNNAPPSSSSSVAVGCTNTNPRPSASVRVGAAVTPSPAALKSRHDGNSDSDSEESSSSSSSSFSRGRKIDRKALTSQLAAADIDTDGLSDYELLRLRNIQRNEAKLASLGLFKGITSGGGEADDDNRREAHKKAAETRRRNKMLAKERVELHDKEQEEIRRKNNGATNKDYNDGDGKDGEHFVTEHLQPQRNVKEAVATYSAKVSVPSKRRMQWESNLSSLRSFYKRFGTFQISATQHGVEYKSLQQWKSRQRKEYLLFKEGRKSVLDTEQVRLLEQLGRDWLVGGGTRTISVRRRTTRYSRSLWADDDDAEYDVEAEEKMIREWEEEDTEEDGGGEVDIGSVDSFSVVSQDSEEDNRDGKKLSREYFFQADESGSYAEEYSLRRLSQQRRSVQPLGITSRSRIWDRADEYNRAGRREKTLKKRKRRRNSPPVRRKKRFVNSLEIVAPAEIASNWSSPSLKTSGSDEDDYTTPNRSSRRRPTTLSLSQHHSYPDRDSMLMNREEESIVSAEETSYQAGSVRRRRKCYIHQRSSRRDEGYELIEKPRRKGGSYTYHSVIDEKPVEEIITGDIDLQAERDRLMAEYGQLYGRKCVILEKRAQVEKELRGVEFDTLLLTDFGGE